MNSRSVALVFLTLFVTQILASEEFRYRHVAGDKYRVVARVSEDVYVNGRYSHTAEILNKVAVEVLEVRGTTGLLACTFQISEKDYGRRATFGLTGDYQSLFWCDEFGRFDIDPAYFMPMVRDVPLFPEDDLAAGDTWMGRGNEVHDFRSNFKIMQPYHIPLIVHYEYIGNLQEERSALAQIKIDYTVFHRVKLERTEGLMPTKIMGQSDQMYLWDIEAGKPHSYQETFNYVFHLASGDIVEYEGSASAELIDSRELDREKAVAEIQQEMEEQGIEDASVAVADEGITITLENIAFPPDSARLLSAEKQKLDLIGEILTRFPDRDILIVGHTARVGSEESCQLLSEQRAKAVGDYLLSIDVRDENQMVFSGRGSRQPLADNSSEEGRQKNRRVQITILEN